MDSAPGHEALGGVFAQRAHSANYYVVYPGNTVHDPFKTAWDAEFRTLGPMASIRPKKKHPWCISRGCGVQNSGPWDPWLPVVENSQLFAQRGHSARSAPRGYRVYAPGHPPPPLD